MKNPDIRETIGFTLPAIPEEIFQMDSGQLAWLSGYLYRMAAEGKGITQVASTSSVSTDEIYVVYGSQTGNSKLIAEQHTKTLAEKGLPAKCVNISDFPKAKLKKKIKLLLVISTHGNGEPPDEAKEFYDFIFNDCKGGLKDLSFAVLALGDSSYEFFCKTGREFDQKFEELGAKRLMPIIECDVDFVPESEDWKSKTLEICEKDQKTSSPSGILPVTAPKENVYDRSNPFLSELQQKTELCEKTADKEVFHLEFSLEDSGIQYLPGDSIGIFPENSSEKVDAFLKCLKLSPESVHKIRGKEMTLKAAATEVFELRKPSLKFLENYAQKIKGEKLKKALDSDAKRKKLIETHDILDILKKFPADSASEEILEILPAMAPRLYSIASSPNAHPEELHLTVKKDIFEKNGKRQEGLCSGFLSGLNPEAKAKIYLSENRLFRLPENDQTPILMVGAGTGIAPFRSFLFEREALESKGKSWLFFGEQKFRESFLYQAEIRNFLKKKILTRFNGAFSRDGDQKIYVQHKLKEHSRDVFAWLEEGANFYLCGDANRMAKDVEKTLLEIIQTEGGKSAEQAEEYLKNLAAEKRYLKDVY